MKLFLKPFLLLPVLAFVVGCAAPKDDDSNYSAHPIGRKATRGNGTPVAYDVDENDQAMERASARARRNVGRFIAALQNPKPGQRDFQVNKLFVQGNEGEHLWLSDVKFTGNRFVGNLDNQPGKITGLKVGNPESVNPDEISDWSYVDNGQLVGGYTIRELYSELSPQEQEEFRRNADFQLPSGTR